MYGAEAMPCLILETKEGRSISVHHQGGAYAGFELVEYWEGDDFLRGPKRIQIPSYIAAVVERHGI